MTDLKTFKIVQVEPFGRGGMAHYTFCLTSALKAKGVTVKLLTANQYELEKDADFEAMGIFKLRGNSNSLPKIIGLLTKTFAMVNGVRLLRKLIKAERPDVLHFQGSLPLADWLFSRFSWRYAKKRGVRVIYTAHNILPHEQKIAIHKFIYKFIYKKADALIVHSASNIKMLTQIAPRHRPVHVVPHGALSFLNQKNVIGTEEARDKLGMSPNDKVVLFFGTIRPYKGLDVLINACALIRDRTPDLKLLIAGHPLEDFTKYEKLIEKGKIGDRVIKVLEYVPNEQISIYLNASDTMVLPYKQIYQSGIIHLAFGFGLPTICSNTGGLPDVVEDGKNGFLFEPGDVKALAELLIKVLNDQALAQRLGAASKNSTAKFSWPSIADKTLEIYGVLDKRKVETHG